MKKLLALLFAILMLASLLTACGKAKMTKTVHCDRCGAAVTIDGDSVMEEDWIIFCESCSEEIGPMVEENDTPLH